MKPYYEHGGITIYHAKAEDVLASTAIRADLLCTDPPYGIGAGRQHHFGYGDKRDKGMSYNPRCRDYVDSDWDDAPPDAALIEAIRACAPVQIIFGGNYFALPPAKCWLVWDKLRGDTAFADCELAWTNLDKTVRRLAYRWNGFMKDPRSRDVRVHPTQKPLHVMQWAISQAPDTCRSIFDPFMGSGTTLEAAKTLGRAAIGIEMEEQWCEAAARRLSQEVLFV